MQRPPTDIWIKESRPGFIEFGTGVQITGVAPHSPGKPPQKYNAGELGFPPGAGRVATKIDHTIEVSEQEFQARLTQLPQTIERELASTRLEGPTNPAPYKEGISRELQAVNKLAQRKLAELANKTATANSYYGYDPIDRPYTEILRKGVTLEKPFHANSRGMHAWIQSYKAAYDARLLYQELQLLNQRTDFLQHTLNNLNAEEWAEVSRANASAVAMTTQALEYEYQIKSNQLAQSIESDIAAIKSEIPSDPLSPLHSIVRELGLLNILAQRKATELHNETGIANAFYGNSPFNRTNEEFMFKARQIETRPGPSGVAMQYFNQSLRAAHEAKLLSQTIHSLNQRAEILQQTYDVLLAAEQEAKRVAAEQAHIEAEAQRESEEQARRDAMEATNTSTGIRPFPVSGAAAANGPVFTVAAGTLAVDAVTTLAIRTALRSAAATATTALAGAVGTASGAVIVVGVAALVYYALRDTRQPFNLSVPLSDLTAYDANELLSLAQANGEIELPVAVGTRGVDNGTEISVAAGSTVPRKVPVRLATYDPVLNLYRTESPDAQSSGMTWTPIVRPGNSSTALPVTQPNVAPYTGATATALEGRIDTNPELDLYSFGGFIYVFPPESGIPPQFVLYRDRRDDPGVASGFGEPVSGIWLGSASQGGAAIPNQIADKLRGRDFSNFRAFREALWKAVASDPELAKQFRAHNIKAMMNGKAPSAREDDHLGDKIKYELHHIELISEGGAVYDIDNIKIVTPKRHAELHKKGQKQ